MQPRHVFLQIENFAMQPQRGGVAHQRQAANHVILHRQQGVAKEPFRVAMKGRDERIVEREQADPPQQASAQRDGKPQGDTAGNHRQAKIETPEGGIEGGRTHELLRRRERRQQDQGAGALETEDHLVASRRGRGR